MMPCACYANSLTLIFRHTSMSHFNCCCALGLSFAISLPPFSPTQDFDKSQYTEMQAQTAHKSFTNPQSLFISGY